jgi:hypothetical protein
MGIFFMALARGSGAETSDHISRATTCASSTRLREYTRGVWRSCSTDRASACRAGHSRR